MPNNNFAKNYKRACRFFSKYNNGKIPELKNIVIFCNDVRVSLNEKWDNYIFNFCRDNIIFFTKKSKSNIFLLNRQKKINDLENSKEKKEPTDDDDYFTLL